MMLITGCARSGTGAICKYLAEEGLDIGHELRLGSDGIASWFLARRSAVPPAGHAATPRSWDRIVHLVRHPLNCIASLPTLSAGAMNWAGYENSTVGHARYWLDWNRFAEGRCDERWRIEDRDDHGLGVTINTRKHEALTWEKLAERLPYVLARRVEIRAEEYGYEAS